MSWGPALNIPYFECIVYTDIHVKLYGVSRNFGSIVLQNFWQRADFLGPLGSPGTLGNHLPFHCLLARKMGADGSNRCEAETTRWVSTRLGDAAPATSGMR